jgi:hypothetical protein
MKEIVLTKGQVALVDDDDFEFLNSMKWCAQRIGYAFYAKRSKRLPDGRKGTEYMHRVVLARKLGRELLRGERPDHEHGNGLDNRRSEVRLSTPSQNNHNFRKHKIDASSGFLGVWWSNTRKRWCAEVQVNGKCIWLGAHRSEVDAAKSRDAYVSAHPEIQARRDFRQDERIQ